MISNQILQNTIDGAKGITGKDYAVLDTDGIVLATTTNSADDYVKETIWRTLYFDGLLHDICCKSVKV